MPSSRHDPGSSYEHTPRKSRAASRTRVAPSHTLSHHSRSSVHLWPLFPRDDGSSVLLVLTCGRHLDLAPSVFPLVLIPATLSLCSASFHSEAQAHAFPSSALSHKHLRLVFSHSPCLPHRLPVTQSLRAAHAASPLTRPSPTGCFPAGPPPTPSAHPGSPNPLPHVPPR